MINDYKEFISKIKSLRTEQNRMTNELIESLLIELTTEFSKYLKNVTSEDLKMNLKKFDMDLIKDRYILFLLNDEYGIIIRIQKRMYADLEIAVNTIYRLKHLYKEGALLDTFNPANMSIEKFVEKTIKKLNRQYEIKTLNKEKNELKRTSNKYNL